MQQISVVCFAASYGVALLLELTRFFFKAPIRFVATLGFTLAGLLAHFVYIGLQFQSNPSKPAWYLGGIVLAACVTIVFVVGAMRNRKSMIGIFLLPTSLALIAASHLVTAESKSANRIWGIFHGMSLLVGFGLVVIGFIAGTLYLTQSYRLKHKLPPSRFPLPSLERLQKLNESFLHASIGALGIGLLSGVVLNFSVHDNVPWTDPIVLASGIWLAWLISAIAFHAFYKPARQGSKVAYLTIGSFIFSALVLAVFYFVPGGHSNSQQARNESTVNARCVQLSHYNHQRGRSES